MKKTVGIIVVIALIVGGWYYFSQQTPAVAPQADTTTGTDSLSASNAPSGSMETGTIETASSTAPEQDITVSGFNFGFTPSAITAKKGAHVKITFINTGGMHDFKIDEFNVATPRLQTGATTTVEFDATKAGTFQYYCSVGNHRAMGMWGTLTVTE